MFIPTDRHLHCCILAMLAEITLFSRFPSRMQGCKIADYVKGEVYMSGKKISHAQGKGSIAHNNRLFSPKNVDRNRTPDNVYYIRKPIAEAYSEQFDEAVNQYNARQKRADRKIKCSYYEHLFNRKPCNTVIQAANKQYSFYEDVVQIGTKDDTGIGTADAEIASACLDEYMQGFQRRNPNFIVFNGVKHMDEATPHLHIDYFPIGHYKQGIPIQNGLAQALKEMGYGSEPNAISRWRESERKILKEICLAHGLEVAEEEQGRGYSMKVEEYKEHKDKIHEYEATEKALEAEIKPLIDAKNIADSVSVTGKKMPVGNARIVSENEFREINEQKKALAVQQNEVKELQNHFAKERLSIQAERERINDETAKLNEKKASLNEFEDSLYSREAEICKQEAKAAELYNMQVNLNENYESVRSAFSELERELYSAKQYKKEAASLQDKVDGLEKQLDRQQDEYEAKLRNKENDISAVKDELTECKEKVKQSESEMRGLKEKLSSLDSFIDKLYEIGAYMARKLRMDFENIVNRRLDGYSLKHIFGDNGRER